MERSVSWTSMWMTIIITAPLAITITDEATTPRHAWLQTLVGCTDIMESSFETPVFETKGNLLTLFSTFQLYLEEDQDIREVCLLKIRTTGFDISCRWSTITVITIIASSTLSQSQCRVFRKYVLLSVTLSKLQERYCLFYKLFITTHNKMVCNFLTVLYNN